jgi:hypothetical protein
VLQTKTANAQLKNFWKSWCLKMNKKVTLVDFLKKGVSWRCWRIESERPCECKLPNDCPMYAFCENWRKMEQEYEKLR